MQQMNQAREVTNKIPSASADRGMMQQINQAWKVMNKVPPASADCGDAADEPRAGPEGAGRFLCGGLRLRGQPPRGAGREHAPQPVLPHSVETGHASHTDAAPAGNAHAGGW